ncbi:MAG: hypothetical protein GY768_21755 [Planctomycetaceae bacterium]|nr:hypothetical protein [Planctomycetaceae bacterium]
MRHLTFAIVLLGFLFSALPVQAQWGTLTGQFIYDGKAPTPQPAKINKDVAVCGKHKLVNEDLVVNPDNGGIQNIVLFLYVKRGKKAPQPHPDYAATANNEVVLDNSNCRFEPHVALLRTTQTLVVGNKDTVGHNTKVDVLKNIPINPIVPASKSIKQKFPKEERLPALVSCSIHPWMSARVLIRESPYMAVTDKDGKFSIKDLPVGKHTFQVWQEAAGYVSSVTVDGKKTKWSKGRFDYTVNDGENDMGVIKVGPSLFKK